jgi:ABC-type glutathione transport system ATPase component
MTENNIIEVQDLVKYFPIQKGLFGHTKTKVHAVDHISFTLKRGKTLGLVGESGCGKSTLGRIMMKLIEPTSGRIIFNRVDITSLSLKEMKPIRKEMQIVFQDPVSSLNPRMTIRQICILRTQRKKKKFCTY